MANPEASFLRVVFMGTAAFAVPTLRALVSGGCQIVGVFTPPDRPAGRGREVRAPAVKLAAIELSLPVFQPERVSRTAGLDQLRQLAPELVVVAAFGEILSPTCLAIPRLGFINIHGSLLPRYRGAAPIQRALMAGETMTGVTVQWMTPEMDAGDIILQRAIPIGEEDDYGTLHDRLAKVGAQLAAGAVTLIASHQAPHQPQEHAAATYAPPLKPAEYGLDWSRSGKELGQLIRALAPAPGARTTREGKLLKIIRAAPVEIVAKKGGIPGQVMEVTRGGFVVLTGDGSLQVLRVQPAGRREMAAADYVKGYHLKRDDRLGS